MLRKAVFILALLCPVGAWAEAWSWGCRFTNNLTPLRPADFVIRHGNVGCYRFTSSDPDEDTSPIIIVEGASALWCFDPDNTDAVADTSRVIIHYCPQGGVAGAAATPNTCIAMGGANSNTSLDGTPGEPGTQNACIRTGPGAFFIEVDVICAKASTDYCEVAVKGEYTTN